MEGYGWVSETLQGDSKLSICEAPGRPSSITINACLPKRFRKQSYHCVFDLEEYENSSGVPKEKALQYRYAREFSTITII